MKVRVIKEFIDKHTGAFSPVGAEIEVTDERFAELKEAGKYVVEIQEQDDKADAAATPANAAEPEKKTRGRRK